MIAIIDYEAGNLTSVQRAISYLGKACVVTRDAAQLLEADRIIFPGVGAAGSAMESLVRFGIDRILRDAFGMGKPILGICLGSQVILESSEENDTACLGLLPGSVKAFPQDMHGPDGRRLKVPHMGWNRLLRQAKHPILEGLDPRDEFYFVHGYYPQPQQEKHIFCRTDYGIDFPSVIGFRNLIATQFHPEKSGRPGLRILNNFCQWKP